MAKSVKSGGKTNRIPFGKGEMTFATAINALAENSYAGIGHCAHKLGLSRGELHALMCGRRAVTPEIEGRTKELLTSAFVG